MKLSLDKDFDQHILITRKPQATGSIVYNLKFITARAHGPNFKANEHWTEL